MLCMVYSRSLFQASAISSLVLMRSAKDSPLLPKSQQSLKIIGAGGFSKQESISRIPLSLFVDVIRLTLCHNSVSSTAQLCYNNIQAELFCCSCKHLIASTLKNSYINCSVTLIKPQLPVVLSTLTKPFIKDSFRTWEVIFQGQDLIDLHNSNPQIILRSHRFCPLNQSTITKGIYALRSLGFYILS